MSILKSLAVFCLLSTSFAVAQVNMEQLRKEIHIFDKVVQASFDANEEDSEQMEPQSIRGIYLAKQGVMLDVSLGHDFGGFGSFGGLGGRGAFGGLHGFNFAKGGLLDDGELGDIVIGAYEQAMDMIGDLDIDDLGGEMGSMSEQQRKELRQVFKDKNALMKQAHESQREAMEKLHKSAELTEAQSKALADEAKVFAEKMQGAAEKISEQANKISEEHIQKWAERMKPFINTFLGAVCEYGASLKSLPANEYLTIVFRNASREKGAVSDLVYVFNKSDLQACRNGEINASQLQEKSNHYTY